MEPVVVERKAMKFIGLAKNVTLAEAAEKGVKVSDVMKRREEITNCINQEEVFGLFTDPDDYNPETDEFEFFIGLEVSSNENIPQGMVYREVPANTYARFTYQGPVEKKGEQVHAYFYSTWLRENDCVPAGQYNIEIYNKNNVDVFSEGPVKETYEDIYFPIQKRS